jgi:hypothetical protein
MHRLFDPHLEDIVNILAFVVAGKGLLVIAHPIALIALDVDVWQEVHRNIDDASALAFLAASARDVKGETAFVEAPFLGLRGLREKIADIIEDFGIGGRVAPRGSPDRLLGHVDDFVDRLKPLIESKAPGKVSSPVSFF